VRLGFALQRQIYIIQLLGRLGQSLLQLVPLRDGLVHFVIARLLRQFFLQHRVTAASLISSVACLFLSSASTIVGVGAPER
jgi:hypothetical protein